MSKVKCQTLAVLILFTALLNLACQEKAPIPEEKLIEVYVDLLIVQDTTRTDSLSLDSLQSIVFTRHNITAKTYDETISYYNSEPTRWEEFFNKAITYAEELKNETDY
jgi:hypothetical protein